MATPPLTPMPAQPPTAPETLPPEVLEALRDVAAPAAAPWWPPAPGWWILALCVLALGAWLFLWLRRRWARRAGQREALASLTALHTKWQSRQNEDSAADEYIRGLMILLRRVAIHSLGRDSVARLTGQAFVDRLNEASSVRLSNSLGEKLDAAQYQGTHEQPVDIEAIHREVELWLAGMGDPADA